jgi:hypothetical protein
MRPISLLVRLRLSLWLLAVWAVVLYVFFVSLATISPMELGAVTAVTVIVAAMVIVRNLRIASELADPGGDPEVRRALNRQRERRGF